jgi:hypothetical protein
MNNLKKQANDTCTCAENEELDTATQVCYIPCTVSVKQENNDPNRFRVSLSVAIHQILDEKNSDFLITDDKGVRFKYSWSIQPISGGANRAL